MNVITDAIIAEYLAAKETERNAKKTADKLKKMILDAAGESGLLSTDGYTVVISDRVSVSLDSARFFADFPDAKDAYPLVTVSKIITAKAKATEKLTA